MTSTTDTGYPARPAIPGQEHMGTAASQYPHAPSYPEHMAAKRAERLAAEQRRARDERSSAAVLAAQSGKGRRARERAERDLAEAADRDAWKRAHGYRLTPEQTLARILDVAAAVLPGATDDERADAAADVALRIAAKHGWTPPAEQVTDKYLRAALSGRILDEREADARRAARADERSQLVAWQEADDEQREQAGRRNVWAHFTDEVPVAAPADDVSPGLLGMGLAAATGGPFTRDERAALEAALSGYGGAVEYAVAAGISQAAADKRLSRGRAGLAERMPDAAAVADALADAVALLGGAEGRPVLSTDQRAALAAVGAAQRAAKREAARGATSPVRGRSSHLTPREARGRRATAPHPSNVRTGDTGQAARRALLTRWAAARGARRVGVHRAPRYGALSVPLMRGQDIGPWGIGRPVR